MTLSEILNSIVEQYSVNAIDILSKKRDVHVLEARRQFAYIANIKHRHPIIDIAKFFGHSSHSAVISMINQVRKRMELSGSEMVQVNAAMRLLGQCGESRPGNRCTSPHSAT